MSRHLNIVTFSSAIHQSWPNRLDACALRSVACGGWRESRKERSSLNYSYRRLAHRCAEHPVTCEHPKASKYNSPCARPTVSVAFKEIETKHFYFHTQRATLHSRGALAIPVLQNCARQLYVRGGAPQQIKRIPKDPRGIRRWISISAHRVRKLPKFKLRCQKTNIKYHKIKMKILTKA